MSERKDLSEPQVERRQYPQFCSKCANALLITAVRPGLWGEERDYGCSNCDYTLTLTVQFED